MLSAGRSACRHTCPFVKTLGLAAPPSPAASEVMTSLKPVGSSHLHFLRRSHPLSSTPRVRAHTNGEGKQQLEQHGGFALVKWPQLSHFVWAAWEQVDSIHFWFSFFFFFSNFANLPPLPFFFLLTSRLIFSGFFFFLAHLMMQR